MKLAYTLIFVIFNVSVLAQPKLEIVNGYTHDWGQVRLIESPLRTRAILKNTGNQPLRIFSVKPSCGCTTAPISNDIIMPGDSAHIDIKLDIKQPEDKLMRKVTIMTNDPKNKNVEYFLVASVTNSVIKYPSKFAMNKTKVGQEVKSGVTLTNKTDKTIKILKISKTHDFINLSIQVGDTIPPGGNYYVEASVIPKNSEPIIGSVAIAINNLDMPKINIPLYCVVEE